jgi:hypothetical protein
MDVKSFCLANFVSFCHGKKLFCNSLSSKENFKCGEKLFCRNLFVAEKNDLIENRLEFSAKKSVAAVFHSPSLHRSTKFGHFSMGPFFQ